MSRVQKLILSAAPTGNNKQISPKLDCNFLTSRSPLVGTLTARSPVLTSLPFFINGIEYLPLGIIGTGTTSTVYKAMSKSGLFVIKEIPLNSQEAHEASLAEISANLELIKCGKNSSLLDHQYTISHCRLVFKFEEGYEFSKLSIASVSHNLRDRLSLFYNIADALRQSHGARVLHLDIKPQNIRLLFDGNVRLLDFGASMILPDNCPAVKKDYFYGTYAYSAPEQLLCRELDVRSDIYSLGVILYKLLTSKLPHTATDDMEYLTKRMNESPEPIINIGAPLESIVLRCLNNNPFERFDSVDDLMDAISYAA